MMATRALPRLGLRRLRPQLTPTFTRPSLIFSPRLRQFSSTIRNPNEPSPEKPKVVRPVRNFRPSQAKKDPQQGEGPSKPKGSSQKKIKIFVILGTLAGVTTVLRFMFSQEDLPEASIDSAFSPTMSSQSASTKRAFGDDQVSVIFVLGGPGAGKGTQCAKLVEDYQFVHLSAGDLLRAEQARPGSQYGQLIADYIKSGQIVPQEITIALLQNAIKESLKENKHKFLIDGFPRKMDQALKFEEDVAESKLILFLDASEEIMLQRLLKRGETSGRTDDNIESIKKRFATFRETSMPVVEYYEKLNKVASVPTAKPVDEVYADVKKALREFKIIQ